MSYPRISKLKTTDDFQSRMAELGIEIPLAAQIQTGEQSPLGRPWTDGSVKIGNRFCILPMEGWDGTSDGKPTDLTRRRWQNFGISGAKFIWGGEAVAVRHDGRANPNQLLINDQNLADLEQLKTVLLDAHQERFGNCDDLYVGLQLTHSGRFARPNDHSRLEPRTLYKHPILDERFKVGSESLLTDDEIKQLIDDFITAAKMAESIGFQFVDIKQCHGYLGHEFLSAASRPGEFGGSFENRTRFLRNVLEGIRTETELGLVTRVSIFDFSPFTPGPDQIGIAESTDTYRSGFGFDGNQIDLDEPFRLMQVLEEQGVRWVCTTAGSPYYNPHIQRPALFPPSDGYLPPEDPLVGVARQIHATAQLKKQFPNLSFVGSAYSYLQEWLPHVGQAAIENSMVDSIGLGRMVLSYPELPADVLAGKQMARKKICRTFSDCTTAPRNGIISGCFPLDPFYKIRPEHELLKSIKSGK